MSEDIIKQIALAFHAHGKECYLVGGTVRDELLGRESHDIDMATDAHPDEIKQIVAETNPLHIIPIGEKFGTIQVHYAGDPVVIIEITTYRGERYTPGSRHPEVQFGTSLVEDLRRRDFTINAIAKNPLNEQYIDPWYGRKDLEDRLIRAVDDPAQRFKDDPLRLLRAVRFATQLDFLIDTLTEMELAYYARAVRHISHERIRDELCKLFLADRVHYGIYLLETTTLLYYILPEVAALIGITQPPHHSMDVYRHTVTVMRMVPPRLELRLAALLHDIAKPQTRTVDERGGTHFYEHEDIGTDMARSILRRLRFGNDIVEQVSKIVKLHMRVNAYTPQWSNGAVRRLYLDAGDVFEDLLDLAAADGISDRNEPGEAVQGRIAHLRERVTQIALEVQHQPLASPLNGDELMEVFGHGPGVWLRGVKLHLEELVIEGVLLPGDKEGAIAASIAYLQREAQL